MSIKPTLLWIPVWLVLFWGSARADAQYRLASREAPVGPDLVRLPPTAEGHDQAIFPDGAVDTAPLPDTVIRPTKRPAITINTVNQGDDTPAVGPSSDVPSAIEDITPSAGNEFVPGAPPFQTVGTATMGGYDVFNWNSGPTDYLSPYMQQSPELHGFFFQYDHLVWSVTHPNATVVGDPAAERLVTVDGLTFFHSNDMNTNLVKGRVNAGERFEFGHMEGERGWFSSVMFGTAVRQTSPTGVNFVPLDPQGLLQGFADSNGDGVDDDLDGDSFYGRHGQDTSGDGFPNNSAPTDFGDLVNFLITFDQFTMRDIVEVAGAEINRSFRFSPHWEAFYGIRYFDFREFFHMSGTGSVISPAEITTVAKNQIVGPNFGARFQAAAYKFIINVEGRFTPGYNHQTNTQNGQIATDNQGAAGEPMALLPTTIMGSFENDEFSMIGELRADAILPVNRFIAFRVGYTGTVLSGISYASPKVVYTLPSFGLQDVDSNETVYISAFTAGLEINR